MDLYEKMLSTLGAAKNHKPPRAVKALVSRNFYLDGNLFIEIFDQISITDSIHNRYLRAKIFVDIGMSIECSLKSLIISLSKDEESPKSAYRKARRLSHNLDNLYKEVKKRSKHRFKLPKRNEQIFDDLKLLGVGSRYSYEIFLLRFNLEAGSLFLGEDLISKTIHNFEWGVLIRNEAVILNNLASKCYKKYLQSHTILSGKRLTSYDRALTSFVNEVNS